MSGSIFLGTPEAALPSLRALATVSEVRLVITQPDRPRGRSRHPVPPPVKVLAGELGIPVAQPSGRRALTTLVTAMAPLDAAVVVAYGQIITSTALAVPEVGWLNVHFSLLPRWRGAAPVAHALLAGDEVTGVSLMRLEEGLDTGPVYASSEIEIGHADDRGSLTDTLAHVGADLLTERWEGIVTGETTPEAQDDNLATIAPKLTPEDRLIDVTDIPGRVTARVRALAPTPGAQLETAQGPVKILAARPVDVTTIPPGDLAGVEGRLVLGVGGGSVMVGTIQPPGRRAMSGEDYLRGRPDLGR